jgi:hypothetical protein
MSIEVVDGKEARMRMMMDAEKEASETNQQNEQ